MKMSAEWQVWLDERDAPMNEGERAAWEYLETHPHWCGKCGNTLSPRRLGDNAVALECPTCANWCVRCLRPIPAAMASGKRFRCAPCLVADS